MNSFLITYDIDQSYRFYSDTGEACNVGVFLRTGENFSKVFQPISLEEDTSEQDEYYVRDMLEASLKTKEFILDGFEEESKSFNLPIDEWVAFYDEASFALIESENLNYNFNIENGQVSINIIGPISEQIIVQLKYYCGFSLIEGESYKVEINENSYEFIAETKDNKIYLGNYSDFFGDDSSEPVEPTEEGIIIDETGFAEIDSYVTYSEDEETKYKITFNKNGEAPQEYLMTSAQMTDKQQRAAAYVGNLNIYDEEATDTEEPFFIYTVWIENSEGEEAYTSWLYVRESNSYNLKVELYNIDEIPSLKGVAVVSFANLSEGVLKDNYGIGINSGDQNLTLPSKAISLFETQLGDSEEPNNKISFKYRGILGTLPNSLDMASGIKSNMVGTQGIYTDNMYIGDSKQYIAFYRENNQGKLDIKGNVYIGDGTLNNVINIENGGISLGNPEGFHIFIDGVETHKYTWGLGFYQGSHKPEYILTEDEEVVTGKDYYIRVEDTYVKVENPSGNPKEQIWYEEKDRRVAYINNNRLSIPYTVVLKGMDLGDKWRWELQSDTDNLTLKWLDY